MRTTMVAADETKWLACGPIEISRITGFNNQEANVFIQLHEKIGALTNGDVPSVKAFVAYPQAAIDWPVGMVLSNCRIAVSSTEANYTALTDTGLDITIEYETKHSALNATLSEADGVDTIVPWTNSNTNKLILATVTNDNAWDGFLKLFDTSVQQAGVTKPTQQWPLAASATINLFFGEGFINQATTGDCAFVLEQTSGAYAGDGTAGTYQTVHV